MRTVFRRTMICFAVAALALMITAVSPATDSAVKVQAASARINNKTYSGRSRKKASGDKVIAFALKFVGNPYRFGGTSLTRGADCSGFIKSVYAHFGVNLPRTSKAMRKAGFRVPGLKAAKPGDILCYKGHVALYMGRNTIVHASNKKYGICIRKNAAYKKIITIRRIFR